MAADPGLIAWVREAAEPLGAITHKRLFGGATLYADGIAFAIVAFDALWFKADAASDAIWDAEGCERFTVEMNGRTASMNYRRAPDDVYDDADTLLRWAALGLEAGRRAPPKKARKKRAN